MQTIPATIAIALERKGARRVCVGLRDDDRENQRRERRIRTQHEDAARAEHGVDKQRNDRRVETVDPADARRFRIGDSHGHQHGGEREAGDEIAREPSPLVAPRDAQAR